MESDRWSHEKRVKFEKAFYRFLDRVYINSKDHTGLYCLGKGIYQGQRNLLTEIFDGLEAGIHDFYILKSRQLGISTVIRALTAFWNGLHGGLNGAIVFDTDTNKQNARREIEQMVENLPEDFGFPGIKTRNRNAMSLDNDSALNFFSAGIKKSKGSGGLGRSTGLSFLHASELCMYDNEEGIESLKQALSEINENRLYLWESTARGYNQWSEIWADARNDETRKKCIFLGWWSKDSQKIGINEADFLRYGEDPPTPWEMERIEAVKRLYNHEITPEQLAWVRRKMSGADQDDPDGGIADYSNTVRLSEQPWTEDDAFNMSGAVFFDPEKLKYQADNYATKKFTPYMFFPGYDFSQMGVAAPPNPRSLQLKVWEDPIEESVYVLGADVAFGHSETNDRSAIQVLRCYSDGIDQVAEYAWPLIDSQKFAWVIAALQGWYAGNSSMLYTIIELNGPGEATWNELQTLKTQLRTKYFGETTKTGLANVHGNVRNYIYNRSDSMGSGNNWMWKTNQQLKIAILERTRDFIHNGLLRLKSHDLLEEMKSIAREGDNIEASGSKKDDRVMALAFATRYWDEKIRRGLMAGRRTREAELAKRRMSVTDQYKLFSQYQFESFLKGKQNARTAATRAARQAMWRGR